MEVTIVAVGKAKSGPAKDLFDFYKKRLPWKVSLKEVEEKKKLAPEQLKEREAELLLAVLPEQGAGRHYTIALDERGKSPTSEKLAERIGDLQQQGISHFYFVIGGAGGLAESVRKNADQLLSFGAMTWPHQLVRGMLMEQLYRTYTLLSNHPYHKS